MHNQGTLLLVLGLAGSGKSRLIQLIKHDYLIEEGFAISGDAESENIAALSANLRDGKFCIVSERKYRSKKERDIFLRKISSVLPLPPTVYFICFEKDLEAANHNCVNRSNKSHDPSGEAHVEQNNRDFLNYEIPENAIIVKIHRISERSASSE